MNVLVVLEHRFMHTGDGHVYTTGIFPYSFWVRYLKVFDNVHVVARTRLVENVPADWQRANGDGVSFLSIPHYIGPFQYLMQYPRIRKAERNALQETGAVILRAPSTIANGMEMLLRRARRPYGIEVVADPYDAFSPGAVRHLLRPFFRWWFTRRLKSQCRHACAAAYVTEEALQRRYPCSRQWGFSDVQLSDGWIVPTARMPRLEVKQFVAVNVGSLEQFYKGTHVLIDAVASCIRDGLDMKLVIVGDGKHRAQFEAQARALRLCDRICFRGHLAKPEALRQELDQADLFLLPSLQEGLPRALVEAMARGLPCIGSHVGGIPELLEAEDLVPPGDAQTLARKIREVLSNPQRLKKMAIRNLEKAAQYREELLVERRLAFYRFVRETTEKWLKANNR
jgi:glycosyltransferase involved in cell wall biosynthesis